MFHGFPMQAAPSDWSLDLALVRFSFVLIGLALAALIGTVVLWFRSSH